MIYPADKQENVPLRFGGEVPNPIPLDPDDAGYPVTTAAIANSSGNLSDDELQEVARWIDSLDRL